MKSLIGTLMKQEDWSDKEYIKFSMKRSRYSKGLAVIMSPERN